jgi:hypothetical protein
VSRPSWAWRRAQRWPRAAPLDEHGAPASTASRAWAAPRRTWRTPQPLKSSQQSDVRSNRRHGGPTVDARITHRASCAQPCSTASCLRPRVRRLVKEIMRVRSHAKRGRESWTATHRLAPHSRLRQPPVPATGSPSLPGRVQGSVSRLAPRTIDTGGLTSAACALSLSAAGDGDQPSRLLLLSESNKVSILRASRATREKDALGAGCHLSLLLRLARAVRVVQHVLCAVSTREDAPVSLRDVQRIPKAADERTEVLELGRRCEHGRGLVRHLLLLLWLGSGPVNPGDYILASKKREWRASRVYLIVLTNDNIYGLFCGIRFAEIKGGDTQHSSCWSRELLEARSMGTLPRRRTTRIRSECICNRCDGVIFRAVLETGAVVMSRLALFGNCYLWMIYGYLVGNFVPLFAVRPCFRVQALGRRGALLRRPRRLRGHRRRG